MKRILTATAVVVGLLTGTVAHADLSPEAIAKADTISEARKKVREAFETPASKAAIEKARAFLNVKNGKTPAGRDCDDGSGAMLICSMEDGVEISVQAVPTKTTQTEAKALCSNPYAERAEDFQAEMKGGDPRKGFTLLRCVHKADAETKAAAEKRIADDSAVKTCTRTLTSSMNVGDVGGATAREMMKEYVPNQIKIVYNAHRSERAAKAKETAALVAETVISVTLEMLEKKGMPALSDECIEKVRQVVLKGTAVFVPKLEQKLIALAETGDDEIQFKDRQKAAEAASNDLSFAYQNVMVMGVAGVVMSLEKK